MSKPSRRQFIQRSSQALGGLALIQATPVWAFATRAPLSDLVHRSAHIMGTPIRVSMPLASFQSAQADASFSRIQRVSDLLTVHDNGSQLMQMNSSAGRWTTGKEISDVARAALTIGHQTDGALDVTILPAMRRFEFLPGKESEPYGIDFTQLEVKGQTVRMAKSGFETDLGGIAKGYAVDQAISSLQEERVKAALLDAGGDLYALGRPEPDNRWKIGIRHPNRDHDLIATIEIENEAVATSGTYVQTRTINGKVMSHLMNPRTGRSVDHVKSSTIVAPNTMTADGLATATAVMQPGAAQSLIESLPGVEGYWVYSDGTHYVSQGLKSRLKML
ncbi:MAG: FAD:protein FMN transferase [Bacteroidetes Order II. Incertae sedis bacterium]|nr:FAD:protein FMN transferase [Bacteroidetes Order II. bacterium]